MKARSSLVEDFQRLPGTARRQDNLKKHEERHRSLKEVLGVEARHLSAVTDFLCRHNLMHTIVVSKQGSEHPELSLKQSLIYVHANYGRSGNPIRVLSTTLSVASRLTYVAVVCLRAMGEVKSLLSPGGSIVK